MNKKIGDADPQPIRAGGSPERTLVCPLEDTGLLERGLQRRAGVAVRRNRVVTEMVGTPFRRRPLWM